MNKKERKKERKKNLRVMKILRKKNEREKDWKKC